MSSIYTILGNADITDEELMAVFTGAEAFLNSRQLTYTQANPEDDVLVTPNHLLIGQVGGHTLHQYQLTRPCSTRIKAGKGSRK